MLSSSLSTSRIGARRLALVRFNSSAVVPRPSKTSTGLTKQELEHSDVVVNQAPNRQATWSQSQESRINIVSRHPARFVQRELEQQPRPYAAIDLIAKEPIRYLTHAEGNVAVCDGNKGNTLHGHPKVFINLDPARAHACGYCGLRYAKEEFREIIEAQEASA